MDRISTKRFQPYLFRFFLRGRFICIACNYRSLNIFSKDKRVHQAVQQNSRNMFQRLCSRFYVAKSDQYGRVVCDKLLTKVSQYESENFNAISGASIARQ